MTTRTHTDPAEPVADPMVAAWLARGQSGTMPNVGADWGALQAALEGERGVGALRSLSTPVRLTIAVVMVVLIIVGVLVATPRVDLGVIPVGRLIADLILLGGPLVLLVATFMHPLHRPPLGRVLRGVVIALAVFVVLASVLLPPAHLAHPASLEGLGDDYVKRAFSCFAFGVVVGLPMVFAVRLLGRSGRGAGRFVPTVLVAAIAVLVGCLGLYLHCPITAPRHLVAGHATVWLPFAIVALLFGRRASDG